MRYDLKFAASPTNDRHPRTLPRTKWILTNIVSGASQQQQVAAACSHRGSEIRRVRQQAAAADDVIDHVYQPSRLCVDERSWRSAHDAGGPIGPGGADQLPRPGRLSPPATPDCINRRRYVLGRRASQMFNPLGRRWQFSSRRLMDTDNILEHSGDRRSSNCLRY